MLKINDGTTEPDTSATELREAMEAFSDHHREIKVMSQQELVRNLHILEAGARNQNWVMYIP